MNNVMRSSCPLAVAVQGLSFLTSVHLFNLYFLVFYILLCFGWFSSLMNFAVCTNTLVFRLFSGLSRPVTVSMAWTGMDPGAPVVILDT